MPKSKGDIIFDTLQDLGILVGDKWNYFFSSEGFKDSSAKRKIEYASSDWILSPNYIYILWNGLKVGHYGQGSVYLLYTSTEINLVKLYDSEGVDDYFFEISFDMSVNCPNGVDGVCWTSQIGGYEGWMSGDVLNGYSHIRRLMLYLASISGIDLSGDNNYHAYKIPIHTPISNKIRSLNYAKMGIGL